MEVDVQKIIRLREHLTITQEEAAKALNIGRTTYLSREKAGDFSKSEIDKLAKLLKVAPAELYNSGGGHKEAVVITESINRLTEIAIRSESMQTAILLGLTKVIAGQTGVDASKILEELTAVANLRSKDFLDQLKQLADLR